jgi:hypothetical protein
MMLSIVRICGERWARQACINVDLEVYVPIRGLVVCIVGGMKLDDEVAA